MGRVSDVVEERRGGGTYEVRTDSGVCHGDGAAWRRVGPMRGGTVAVQRRQNRALRGRRRGEADGWSRTGGCRRNRRNHDSAEVAHPLLLGLDRTSEVRCDILLSNLSPASVTAHTRDQKGDSRAG